MGVVASTWPPPRTFCATASILSTDSISDEKGRGGGEASVWDTEASSGDDAAGLIAQILNDFFCAELPWLEETHRDLY